MGSVGWRVWRIVVQAAAFVGAANILTLLLFAIFARWPTANQLPMLREAGAFVLGGLILFGAVPYMLAGSRFGRWRTAALAGLMPGLLLGFSVALLALGSPGAMERERQAITGSSAIFGQFAISGALFLFFVGMAVASALLVRALVPTDILDESRNPARPHWRDALPLVAAASVLATMPLDEKRSIALGCFESPRSAMVVADFYLHVPEDQLRALAKGLSSHADDQGWSVHGTVVDASDQLVFAQSICLKPGLEVGLERDYPLSNNRLRIIVFAQDADIAWQSDVRNLLLVLGRAGQVTRKPDPKARSQPAWVLAIPVEPESPAIPPSTVAPAAR